MDPLRPSFRAALAAHRALFDALAGFEGPVIDLARRVEGVLRGGNKVLFCGNGGSAADSQHLAAEFVVRYRRDRVALPALALTTDTSILTAHPNDYAFETVFSRQVEALGRPGDLLIGLTTSGNSENVIRAVETARAQGLLTVAFTGGDGGRIRSVADDCFVLPSSDTARVQEATLFLGHWVCETLDILFGDGP